MVQNLNASPQEAYGTVSRLPKITGHWLHPSFDITCRPLQRSYVGFRVSATGASRFRDQTNGR